jgi:hypothetical protein
MASTKIINVLKDDKFEEILDLFKNTQAKEVIFVLPKTSRAFKSEEHFVILENEAGKSGKKISLLCSSPETNKLAKKYKFDVLLTKNGDEKPLITAVNQFDSGKDDETDETIEEEKELETEDEAPEEVEQPTSKFSPAMYQEDNDENDEYQLVTISKMKRGLEDIVKQSGIPLKIASNKERPINLNVKREQSYQPVDDIKNVWRDQSERASISRDSIWTGINNKTKKSFRNFPKRLVVILGGVSVILLGTIIYMSTGSAKIDIVPKKQPLDIQLKVSASDRFSVVDSRLNKIPGQLFNVEKSANQTFQTTGEKEVAQKARGTITVYNEYGTAPQVLIATTRFQTSDGLIFRTLKGIVVPGTTVVGGKIVPGDINVEVIADKAGQSYNIPASKFGIPAFSEKGDPVRYEKVYGKSDTAMKGGAIGKAKVVTDSDFNTAKQTLTDRVIKDIEDSLKTQTAGLKVINASAIKLKDPESTAKVDEASNEFAMTVNGAIKTVGFKEDDLKSLIKQYIDKTQDLTVIPEKLTISYDNIIFDEISNTLTFNVNIKGNGYAKVDADKIKIDLAGKNEQEIKDYFRGAMAVGVDTAKVVLSPFWVKRIPQDKERTRLQINY